MKVTLMEIINFKYFNLSLLCRESNFALRYFTYSSFYRHLASIKRGTVFEPVHLLIYSDGGEGKNEERGREATDYSKSMFSSGNFSLSRNV